MSRPSSSALSRRPKFCSKPSIACTCAYMTRSTRRVGSPTSWFACAMRPISYHGLIERRFGQVKPDIGAQAASRLLAAIAVGALSTSAAVAGTAITLTGSASPGVWVAAYRHSQECAAAGAAQDPNCSAAAAQDWAQRQLAAQLEQQAAQLKSKQPAVADPQGDQGGPAVSAPAVAPQSAATTPHSDDSGEAGDD